VTDYFDVLNIYGQLMYRVYEEPSIGCGIFRPHTLVVREPDDTVAIVMRKRYDIFRSMRVSLFNPRSTKIVTGRCNDKQRSIIFQKVSVYCPPETYVGSVEEKWGICCPTLILRNKEGDAMIEVRVHKRPFMSRFKYHPDFEFEVLKSSRLTV